MQKIFVISDNGELLGHQFKTLIDASNFIDEDIDEEDQYLMSIYKMTNDEHFGKLNVQNMFCNDAQEIDTAIQESDDSEKLYEYLNQVDGAKWIRDLYAVHFKFALLEGGYASEEAFEEVELLSFKDFLNELRKEIDYADDYDKARIKHCK